MTKNLPCARRLRGIFRQNLVRPNLYTEKPLKRNDRYDRKTHQKKCRINERQIRIRNSLTPRSNPHRIKNNSHETDKDYQNSITYSCRRSVCLSASGGVFHRRNDRILDMWLVANRVGHRCRRIFHPIAQRRLVATLGGRLYRFCRRWQLVAFSVSKKTSRKPLPCTQATERIARLHAAVEISSPAIRPKTDFYVRRNMARCVSSRPKRG